MNRMRILGIDCFEEYMCFIMGLTGFGLIVLKNIQAAAGFWIASSIFYLCLTIKKNKKRLKNEKE